VRPYGWYDKEIWEVANTVINKNSNRMNDLIMVTAFCDTKDKEETLRKLVNQISSNKDRFDLMVVSHSVIPDDIVEKCDYYFYDKKNELLYDYNLRSKPWFAPMGDRPILSIFTGFFNTHLAIWRMLILGNSIAKNCIAFISTRHVFTNNQEIRLPVIAMKNNLVLIILCVL
jgi:hypothetical protein